jgi:DNA-binding transcriptional LysR family regulator
MDLNLLRVFVAIYDTGSVSEAAKMLEMHQSAASNALSKLRTQLNDPLFVRASGAMRPTPAARKIVEPTRSALDALAAAVRIEDRFDPATTSEELRILTGDVVEMPILGQLIPVIEKLAPQVTIHSVSRRPHEIEAALEARDIDIAIGHFPELKSNNLFATNVGHFTFGFFGRSTHPLAGSKPALEEFCSARHISVEADSSITGMIERWLRSHRIRRTIAVRTSHFHCVPAILQMSDLIAVVPTNYRGAWFYGGKATRIVPPFALPRAEIRAYWHRSVKADARHRWWRRLIVNELRQGAEAALRIVPDDHSTDLFRWIDT